MKKLSVLLVAALMVIALTIPAAAFENEFGGYWRTRFYTQTDYAGSNQTKGNQDVNATDTRTRLFYTAKFSDNLKFVNKFEFNATWGQNKTYGQVGADSTSDNNYFRVKNSYVDFKLAQQRFTVGVQDFMLARGYLFNDDASGAKMIFKVNDDIYLPLIYMKLNEGGYGYVQDPGKHSASDYDVDAWIFYPSLFLTKDHVFKPHVAYMKTENISRAAAKNVNFTGEGSSMYMPGATKVDLWTAGLEYDGKYDIFDFGASAIFQFGDVTVPAAMYGNHDKLNNKGMLFDIFGGVNLGPANLHLKGIWSSGNKATEDPKVSGDLKGFITPGAKDNWGASYYWAEIMGDGIFDNQTPAGAPGDKISNVYIYNFGATYKLLQDLKFAADLWYARRAEDVQIASPYATKKYSSDLGTEIDLVATYTIVDNLKLDLVGAYLWAGDAITKVVDPYGANNPYELGAQLSLAF
jgi:hypothetical protein